MKRFALRHPLIFSSLLAFSLLGLIFVSKIPFPKAIVGDVGELSPEQIQQPSAFEQAISSINNAETLYLSLVVVLSVALISAFGWWREIGFNRPKSWRSLILLWFPILVIVLTLSGGVRVSGPLFFGAILIAVALESFGSEMLFRGFMWRILAPSGLFRAVIVTSLLSGGLTLARTLSSGPWPEAVYLTLTATCGGFTYAAIRWRTASLWPVIAIHLVLALSIDMAVVRMSVFPYLLLATTVGFIGYGLFLLRNQRVRDDGGMSMQEPVRVR
ncbi:MAG: CPBP family intramembrane glutamic endopeptidase [Rubrobacteraceae bacterium]